MQWALKYIAINGKHFSEDGKKTKLIDFSYKHVAARVAGRL